VVEDINGFSRSLEKVLETADLLNKENFTQVTVTFTAFWNATPAVFLGRYQSIMQTRFMHYLLLLFILYVNI
jgi:hypothetical protein